MKCPKCGYKMTLDDADAEIHNPIYDDEFKKAVIYKCRNCWTEVWIPKEKIEEVK